ncbi:hypothetical protein [Mesorhizobium sp. f-mel]
MPQIHVLDEVTAQIAEAAAACHISIIALGRVSTTGWSDGRLVRIVNVVPPSDGIVEFEFLANAPSETAILLEVLTPISANSAMENVEISNFWGTDLPLRGIRVLAARNSKTVEVLSKEESSELNRKMSPRAVAVVAEPTGPAKDPPGYQEDIRPLFRNRDANAMRIQSGFDLHVYEDVKANATGIAKKLRINMPCDGLWPPEDIAKFDAWVAGGMLA